MAVDPEELGGERRDPTEGRAFSREDIAHMAFGAFNMGPDDNSAGEMARAESPDMPPRDDGVALQSPDDELALV